MAGKTIGDLLNTGGVTWGSFMGGFRLDTNNANGTTGCKRSTHSTVVGADVIDSGTEETYYSIAAALAASIMCGGNDRSRITI